MLILPMMYKDLLDWSQEDENEITVEILENTVFRTLTEAPPEEQKRETLMRETGADDEEEKEEVQEKPKVQLKKKDLKEFKAENF